MKLRESGAFAPLSLFLQVPALYVRNVPPSSFSTLGEVFQYSNWSTRVL